METSSQIYTEFLPISRADMEARGWDQLDFVVVGGDEIGRASCRERV